MHTSARKPSRTELAESLGLLAEAIEAHRKEKPVILIDEYDQPITTASVNGFYGAGSGNVSGVDSES